METGSESSPLDTPAQIAEFIADAMKTGDAAQIAKAIGIAAKANGMSSIAREAGIAREQLYRSFGHNGNPTLKSVLAVLQAMGVELTAAAKSGLMTVDHDTDTNPDSEK